jgi:hypothetical protein
MARSGCSTGSSTTSTPISSADGRSHQLTRRLERFAARVAPPGPADQQRREVVDPAAALAAEAPPGPVSAGRADVTARGPPRAGPALPSRQGSAPAADTGRRSVEDQPGAYRRDHAAGRSRSSANCPPRCRERLGSFVPTEGTRSRCGWGSDEGHASWPLLRHRPRRDGGGTDPDALQRALEGELARANSDDPDLDTGFTPGFPREEQLLILIAQTLAHPLASPELRGALYDVASRLDRVKVAQGVKDPAGRPATAITLKRSAIHYAIFFDPATSEVLATGRVAYDPGLRYSDYTLYLERATVNSIRERP